MDFLGNVISSVKACSLGDEADVVITVVCSF